MYVWFLDSNLRERALANVTLLLQCSEDNAYELGNQTDVRSFGARQEDGSGNIRDYTIGVSSMVGINDHVYYTLFQDNRYYRLF